MKERPTPPHEPIHGKSTLLGAATILFTLLLLIIGGGVALYARLEDDSGTDTDNARIEVEDSSSPPERTPRAGRRLRRTEVRQLEFERTQLQSEYQVLLENERLAILPEDRSYVASQKHRIERRLEEIERTLRERR